MKDRKIKTKNNTKKKLNEDKRGKNKEMHDKMQAKVDLLPRSNCVEFRCAKAEVDLSFKNKIA